EIYLKAPAQRPADASAALAESAERAWTATRDTTSQVVLEEFIRRYGDSFYATLARARLDELKKRQVAAVPSPAIPAPPGNSAAPVAAAPTSAAAPSQAAVASTPAGGTDNAGQSAKPPTSVAALAPGSQSKPQAAVSGRAIAILQLGDSHTSANFLTG